MLQTPKYDYLFKIILLGNSGVGKTSFLSRYIDDTFDKKTNVTIGINLRIKTIDLDGEIIKHQIWDTAGQLRFNVLNLSYYKSANGIIIIYDVTNRRSFDDINYWFNDVNCYVSDISILLIGNKSDMEKERVVSYDEGKNKANQLNIEFIEISSKESAVINEIFIKMTNIIKKKKNINSEDNTIKKQKCCLNNIFCWL